MTTTDNVPLPSQQKIGRIAPLAFGQQRLWFLHHLLPNKAAYNIAYGYQLSGKLDPEALEKAFQLIVWRHEILRTTFALKDGLPCQLISEEGKITLPITDLSHYPKSERVPHAESIASDEARRPFDLEQGPLLRLRLLRLAENEHHLLIVIHHIIADGWSLGIIGQELEVLYSDLLFGRSPSLPPLPIQYADFARWQREWMGKDRIERQVSYWKQQLAALQVCELPTDYPRPTLMSYCGSLENVYLPHKLTEELRTLSQQEGVTLFMTLLAAFQIMLSRYTGQDSSTVATPVAGRHRANTERLIGFFLNTVLLRVDLSKPMSFRELLQQVRKVVLSGLINQDVPFEKLVEVLQPERTSSHNPLFQVMFGLQSSTLKALHLPNITTACVELPTGASKFDLNVALIENDDHLSGTIEYSTDIFTATTIRRMFDHYRVLLEAIVAHPDQQLMQFPLLPEQERQMILADWNKTATPYPLFPSLHHLVEMQVQRTPEAIAVIFEGQNISYRELNSRSNQLAHKLVKLGVNRENPVAICMERSIEMVVGLLGILKAGAAYLPLDPFYPVDRLTFMLEDSQAPVLLTQQRFAALLPTPETQVLCLDTEWETIAQESSIEDGASAVTRDNLAYIIYTSGSTGQPKGAMIPHKGICNRLLWMQDAYCLDHSDAVLQKTSFSFDVSVWEFFWPLIAGARLVLARPEGQKDSAYLVNMIVRHHITTIHFVPSMLQVFLQEEGLEQCVSLKRVICSGEALSLELQRLFFSRLPAELHNLYGPTEASVEVTFWACQRASNLRIVPIGKPIANTQMYILDANLEPVPPNATGELYISGVGLARGYLGRPELTAERFIPNPFSKETGMRMYKTGDLARYLPDGNIDFLGRIDHQVKIRGYRVELGEIEVVLQRHPALKDAVVVSRDDSTGGKCLVAYIVPERAMKIAVSELRRFLQASLPDYMLPSAFVFIDAMPLNSNGKLDRRALPSPQIDGNQEEAYIPARSETEYLLVTAWENVLGVRPIGIYDNYFSLGGDSIRSIQIVNEIYKYGFRVSPMDLLQYQTIAELASHLHQGTQHNKPIPFALLPAPETFALFKQQDIEDIYPATHMQKWMLSHYAQDQRCLGVYHLQLACILRHDNLSLSLLEKTLQALVQMHPGLRTVFACQDGITLQVVKRHCALSISTFDLRHLDQSAQKHAIHEAMVADRHDPFDSTQFRSPLFRFKLFLTGDTTVDLLLSIHHAIYDGWSNTVFENQLLDLYQRFERAQEPLDPQISNTNKEFVALEREIIMDDKAQQFWRSYLSGYAPTTLSPKKLVPNEPGETGEICLLDEYLVENLQKQVIQHHLSLKALFLSAYLDLIREVSGSKTPVVGIVSNGRSERMTQALTAIGLFWNIVPVIGRVSSEQWIARVKATQEDLIQLEPYVRVPLPDIQRLAGHNQLFFGTMNFVHFHNQKVHTDQGSLQIQERYGYDKFHFPLNTIISLDTVTGRIEVRIEYDECYFDRVAIQHMIEAFIEKLRQE